MSSSNMKALERANKTFAILERDAENGCEHCIAVLKEIFDNSKGTGPTNETQSTRFLPKNQFPTDTTHRHEANEYWKSKNYSAN